MLMKLPRVKMPGFIRPGLEGLSPGEIGVLMDFHSRGSKTLGEIVSSGSPLGSKIVDAIEKLRDFGFIRRDWERETELGVDVVYTLTEFGRETARKYTVLRDRTA